MWLAGCCVQQCRTGFAARTRVLAPAGAGRPTYPGLRQRPSLPPRPHGQTIALHPRTAVTPPPPLSQPLAAHVATAATLPPPTPRTFPASASPDCRSPKQQPARPTRRRGSTPARAITKPNPSPTTSNPRKAPACHSFHYQDSQTLSPWRAQGGAFLCPAPTQTHHIEPTPATCSSNLHPQNFSDLPPWPCCNW